MLCVHTYIYIYIQRERDRERERARASERYKCICLLRVGSSRARILTCFCAVVARTRLLRKSPQYPLVVSPLTIRVSAILCKTSTKTAQRNIKSWLAKSPSAGRARRGDGRAPPRRSQYLSTTKETQTQMSFRFENKQHSLNTLSPVASFSALWVWVSWIVLGTIQSITEKHVSTKASEHATRTRYHVLCAMAAMLR